MDMGEITHHVVKKYELDRTRANDLWIISSRPIQDIRVTELLVCRILQEKR